MATDRTRILHRTAMLTDVGMVREHNEDSMRSDPEGDFFIVADGMGGHAAGEVASAMAADGVATALTAARATIRGFAGAPSEDGRKGLAALLDRAVRDAHHAVFARGASETDKQGMGTTLDAVLLAGAEAFVAHVGDSRTYLIRDGKCAQITTDHTVAEVLVMEGKLSAEEAQVSPLRTILVNAVGVAADVGVEMAHLRLRPGDRLLLCSDGLHDYYATEQEIAGVVVGEPPADALERMVSTAKSRGGHDNITGILIEVLDVPEDPVAIDDTGKIPMVDAVPREVGREDTLPVAAAIIPTAARRPRDTAPAPGGPPPAEAGSVATARTDPALPVIPPADSAAEFAGTEKTMPGIGAAPKVPAKGGKGKKKKK
jgi:serine/threonine protein phosphatase PrpC